MRISAALLSVLVLAGCASNPAPYQGKNYGAEPAQRLSFNGVLVDSVYTAPGAAPNVEHELSPSPEAALRLALQQKYQPIRSMATGAAQLRVTITDAHVTRTDLPQPTDWFAREFGEQKDTQFDGRLAVEARTEGGASRRVLTFTAEATRTLQTAKLSGKALEAQINGMVANMVDDVMAQVAQGLEGGDMAGSIISGPDDTVMPVPSGRWDKVRDWR
jgi:hypothetical protein